MQRFLIVLMLIGCLFSCRKDFDAEFSYGELTFSKDTLFLDTVFTNIGSSTYSFKVYNNSNSNITIPQISLENGIQSLYRLNIDGKAGQSFEDVYLKDKDSLYVFVEVTADYSSLTNPIYTDVLQFDTGIGVQEVPLITLIKDAHFLFPSKNNEGMIEQLQIGVDNEGETIQVNGFRINEDITFTNEKPYVIYGYCAISNNSTLTINEGVNIHFHENSGLIIEKGSSLTINGSLTNKVFIEGDRLEQSFSETPGQWGTIWLRAGSVNNTINHTIIKNATAGLVVDSIANNGPTLKITNSQIYNSSNYGMLCRQTHIDAGNLIINNSGESSLACLMGGNYRFVHSTISNFWNASIRQFPSVLINNYLSIENNGAVTTQPFPLESATFFNCIIDGNNQMELLLDNIEGTAFELDFQNNLIRFNDISNSFEGIPEYDFSNTNYYSNIILNGNSAFSNPLKNDFRLLSDSDAIQKALPLGTSLMPTDLAGRLRTIPADLGALQYYEE